MHCGGWSAAGDRQTVAEAQHARRQRVIAARDVTPSNISVNNISELLKKFRTNRAVPRRFLGPNQVAMKITGHIMRYSVNANRFPFFMLLESRHFVRTWILF